MTPVSPPPTDHADVALVLGAHVKQGGAPSAALKRRALHAARLYRAGRVGKILATGGKAGPDTPTEASVIRSLCRTGGVPDSDILTEENAVNTMENIAFSLPILQQAGFETVCIVTDRFHAPRARMVARAAGAEMQVSCPAPGLGLTGLARAWLREVLALGVYRMRLRQRGG